LQGEDINIEEKKKRINNCLKAIDDDNIGYLKTLSELEFREQFFNIIKSGYNKIKSWFPKNDPISESILSIASNLIFQGIIKLFIYSVTAISSISLIILGIIGLTKAGFIQNEINDYIKKKNLINLEIILEKIKTVFTGEEDEVLDFFRNYNIYSLAYDSNIIYYKNAGAAFFPINIEGLGKKGRKLIKDSGAVGNAPPADRVVGFNNDNDIDENNIYNCYEQNILQIRRFFNDTRDNFRRLLARGQSEENLNDNDDIKQIVNKLVEVNERAINKNNDIIIKTENHDIDKPLLNNGINDYDNNQKIIPDEESQIKLEKDDEEKENLKNKINELNDNLLKEKKTNEIKEEELNKIQEKYNLYQNENSRLNEQYINLRNEYNNLNGQKNIVDIQLTNLNEENKRLKYNYEVLRNKNIAENRETQTYKNQNSILRGQLSLNQQKIQEIQTQYNRLKTEYKRISEIQKENNKKMSEIQTENNRLKKENKKMSESFALLDEFNSINISSNSNTTRNQRQSNGETFYQRLYTS
jgi:hypothetical protein